MSRREVASVLVPGLGGAALLAFVSRRYRLDAFGDDCRPWPGPGENVAFGLALLVAIGLLALAWLRSGRLGATRRQVLGLGLAVHAVALCGLPFLSEDPLFYVAIGRALQTHHSAYQSLRQSLPGDPLIGMLPPGWRDGSSAYAPGFHALAWLIALVGHGRLALELWLHQLAASASVVLTALLVGRAAAQKGEAAAARALGLVLLCPLSLVEATVGAHNDALMMPAIAAFTLFEARRSRPLAGLAALASAALVKLSALLLAAYRAFAVALARVPARRALLAGGAAGALGLAALLVLGPRHAFVSPVLQLLGSPDDPVIRCTRSVECLPRGLLWWVLHRPLASWAVGLAFRWGSGLWLLYCAARGGAASAPGALARWAATFVFGYYLFLHGFMQSWYLLALVPLLPFADERLLPTMRLFCLTALAYYAVQLPFNCMTSVPAIAARELSEAMIVILPPAIYLLVRKPWRQPVGPEPPEALCLPA